MLKPFSMSLCLILVWSFLQAQDMIYYKKHKVDNWKITDINNKFIKAIDVKNPGISYSTTPSNVLFVFNSLGNFLALPKSFEKKEKSEIYISNYFHRSDNSFYENDKIITIHNKIIVCSFHALIQNKVLYAMNNKQFQLPKSEVALIIFKNGNHRLIASVDIVYAVLNSITDMYNTLAFSSYTRGNNSTERPVTANNDSLAATTSHHADSNLIKTTAGVHSDTTKKELDHLTLLKLQSRALQNIKELGTYIQFICNKESDPDEIRKTIQQAVALFVNDARIEISSVNRTRVQRYKVWDYLIRLGDLKYDKVNIQWYNVQYASELHKGPDGCYYGIIEFEQRFTSVSGDKKVYEDITRKTVEIVLKSYEKKRGGETTLEWDVFLGDIGVIQTNLPG